MCRYRKIKNVDESIRDVFYTKERYLWVKMPGSRLTNRMQGGKVEKTSIYSLKKRLWEAFCLIEVLGRYYRHT